MQLARSVKSDMANHTAFTLDEEGRSDQDDAPTMKDGANEEDSNHKVEKVNWDSELGPWVAQSPTYSTEQERPRTKTPSV